MNNIVRCITYGWGMAKKYIYVFSLVLLILAGCSKEEPDLRQSVHIKGQIVVDEQIDDSGDYSGIQLLSTIRTGNETPDTLFFALTDEQGNFAADALFEKKDQYPILISRNNNVMGILSLVFAEGDTIQINATLPRFNESVEIESYENDTFRTYERVDRSFSRVANYINAGMISADSVDIEIDKWSDIYWEVFEEYPGTYASKLSGESSITILRGRNDSLMISRTTKLIDEFNSLTSGTREVLIEYFAETEGLDRALQFIDKLQNNAVYNSDIMEIEIDRIELLYDSSRTTEAQQYLETFREKYTGNTMAMEWAENKSYDLEFLAPGYPFPEFNFILINGDSLSTSDLQGTPFLIEITRFDNSLYQQQFDRTVAIYQIYRNFELEIITVPLSTNDAILDAFFSERDRLWHVVKPGSYDANNIVELLNLNRIPTRYLVNSDGTIIRRYIGTEYDEVVKGLQQISTLNNE